MINVSDKRCRENQNTHFMFSDFFSKIVPFMRKCGKNIVERGRPQMTIWRMRIACWIRKATDTHSEYVTHSFSTTTIVARTRLNVTLYMHCLPGYIIFPSMPLSSRCTLSFRFLHHNSLSTYFLAHTCHMPHPARPTPL